MERVQTADDTNMTLSVGRKLNKFTCTPKPLCKRKKLHRILLPVLLRLNFALSSEHFYAD